jgi:hypothetical protein
MSPRQKRPGRAGRPPWPLRPQAAPTLPLLGPRPAFDRSTLAGGRTDRRRLLSPSASMPVCPGRPEPSHRRSRRPARGNPTAPPAPATRGPLSVPRPARPATRSEFKAWDGSHHQQAMQDADDGDGPGRLQQHARLHAFRRRNHLLSGATASSWCAPTGPDGKLDRLCEISPHLWRLAVAAVHGGLPRRPLPDAAALPGTRARRPRAGSVGSI